MKRKSHSKSMEHSKSSSKKDLLPQETREISNNLTLYLKELEKEQHTKPKLV